MSQTELDSKTGVHLSEIGQIAITVRDLAKAKAFYQDVLGMRFLFDAGTMVFFQCGAVRLMLGRLEGEPEKAPANAGTILYFKVADLMATCEALEKASVEFVQRPALVARMPDHELWLAAFKDVEGNVLELMSEVKTA